MVLTNKKEEQLKRMPLIQNRMRVSKNGRYVIHETILTHIRPREYYEAVLANSAKVTEEPLEEDDWLVEDGCELAVKL